MRRAQDGPTFAKLLRQLLELAENSKSADTRVVLEASMDAANLRLGGTQ